MNPLMPQELASAVSKWKPYPAYKATEVEWLGEIPEHWEVKRLRYACFINPPKAEVDRLSPSTEVSFLPMEAIGDNGQLKLEEVRTLETVWQGYTYFREDDVVVAKITPCFENGKGALSKGLVAGIGFGTTELHVLRPRDRLVALFVFYISQSHPFRSLGIASMQGAAGQQRVTEEFVKDFMIGLPRPPEQNAITSFLDRETVKIDALVNKKERLIDLLQEKRAAIISQAVTKGLDPNVPMKESGIEWLGEIPAHWEVKRLKHVVPAVTVGIVVTPARYYVDAGVPCLRSLNVATGRIDSNDMVFISPESNELHRKSKIHTGDILVVRTGRTGAAVIVPADHDGANCIDLLIIRHSQRVLSRFLWYAINSWVSEEQIAAQSEGAIQAHYNTETLGNLLVILPQLEEQKSIADFLDRETVKTDALIAKVREGIERLKEYRMALISAAVTGKIDVRENMAEGHPASAHPSSISKTQ